MKNPHPEFNFDAAVKATNEAIKRVDENAEPEWKAAAEEIVLVLARLKQSFTTDEVWRKLAELGVEGPHEPRAMGGVMRRMQGQGIIRAIDDFQRSIMVKCHQRRKQLWIGC